MIQEGKIWVPAIVQRKLVEYPRSYLVTRVNDGKCLSRNTLHMRKTGIQLNNSDQVVLHEQDLDTWDDFSEVNEPVNINESLVVVGEEELRQIDERTVEEEDRSDDNVVRTSRGRIVKPPRRLSL